MLLATLAIGFVMAMIDVTAVNLALPAIALDLHVPLSGLVWVVDGYTLMFAALLLAGGSLADRYGARNAYVGGLAVFLLGSLLCGLAPTNGALIGARLLQGVGAALFMPSSLSLLTSSFTSEHTRIKMLALWSAIVGGSSALGPLAGGILVHSFGWRSVFLINLPIGLLGVLLAHARIAPTPGHQRPLSLGSHALCVVTLAALSFFLIEGPALGWTSAPALGSGIVAVLAAMLLVRAERRGAHPLLPRALFSTSGFAASNVTGFLINYAAFGQIFLISLFLQQARDAAPLEAGVQLLPMMSGFVIGNVLSSRISAHLGTRASMLIGLSVAALASLALTAFRQHTPYPLLAAGVLTMNIFVGIAIPAMTTTVMQLAGRTNANSAAAALNANRQIGALVGVALTGTILHFSSDWNERLPLALAANGVAYLAGAVLVMLWVGKPAPQQQAARNA
jgi:DHA2 family methylenomycin A resistance protein-like MFS transporter